MQKRQSDLKLLDSLYCEYHQLVYKLISNRLYRGLGTKADADDLMQDVFIIAGNNISTLRNHPNQIGWLIQTANNVVRNHIRSKARHREQLFHSLDLHRSDEDFDAVDFDASLQNVLSPDDYAILRAYCFDNRPHDEICAKHGLSEAALRVRISRIRKSLRNFFILVVTLSFASTYKIGACRMMSNQKKSKIMERLANDPILEMNDDDLELLLNAELAKPADEIDSSLVEEILDALNAPAPTPEQSEASWRVIKEHYTRQAKARTIKAFSRFGAAAAVVIMIMFVPLRDAEAFRWTFIEKILKPVAETFGIVIDDQESIPKESESTLYSIEDTPSEYVEYDSLEDVPKTAYGYHVRPNWIPEGFEYSSASQFIGPDSEIYSIDFVNRDAWFGYRVYIVTSDSAIYSQEFERNLEIPIEEQLGSHVVTFYTNDDDKTQSVFWIHENAHYSVIGDLSVDEVKQFILSLE